MELKSTERKASSKGTSIAKISKKMDAVKEERVATDNVTIRVTKDYKFDGGRFIRGKSLFLGKSDEVLSFAQLLATKLNSDITLRHLSNGASFAVLALQILSGCPFDEVMDGKEFDNELELLLTKIMKKKKGVFKKATEAAAFSFVQKITVAQAVDTKSVLRLSISGFTHLRLISSNFRLKIFPSEFCSVFVILNKRTTYFLEYPECQVNILFGSDKSGSYTNYHFEIVAPGIVSSAYNVHIFSKFEGR